MELIVGLRKQAEEIKKLGLLVRKTREFNGFWLKYHVFILTRHSRKKILEIRDKLSVRRSILYLYSFTNPL